MSLYQTQLIVIKGKEEENEGRKRLVSEILIYNLLETYIMKKKTRKLFVLPAIAWVAISTIQHGENKVALSDILLKNVEAFAGCEPYYGGSCGLTLDYICCQGRGTGCSPCD